MPRLLTKAEAAAEEEAIRQEITLPDGYDLLAVRIKRGAVIDNAIVALCPDPDPDIKVVTADVCIDGHTVP